MRPPVGMMDPGMSLEEVKKRRRIADLLASQRNPAPRTVGGGIASFGGAIGAALANRGANKAQEQYDEQQDAAFDRVVGQAPEDIRSLLRGLKGSPNAPQNIAQLLASQAMGERQAQADAARKAEADEAKYRRGLRAKGFVDHGDRMERITGGPAELAQQRFNLDQSRHALNVRKANRPQTPQVGGKLGQIIAAREGGYLDNMSEEEYQAALQNAAGGEGMELVVGPDGSVAFGTKGAPRNFGRAATNELEKDIVGEIDSLAQLSALEANYDPEFLSIPNQVEDFFANYAERFGIDTGKARREFAGRRQKFRSRVMQAFNAYRKEITGAAAAMQELNFLQKAFINEEMSPPQFEAALGVLKENASRARRIKTHLRNNGIPQNDPRFGEAFDQAWTSGVAMEDRSGGELGDMLNRTTDELEQELQRLRGAE